MNDDARPPALPDGAEHELAETEPESGPAPVEPDPHYEWVYRRPDGCDLSPHEATELFAARLPPYCRSAYVEGWRVVYEAVQFVATAADLRDWLNYTLAPPTWRRHALGWNVFGPGELNSLRPLVDQAGDVADELADRLHLKAVPDRPAPGPVGPEIARDYLRRLRTWARDAIPPATDGLRPLVEPTPPATVPTTPVEQPPASDGTQPVRRPRRRTVTDYVRDVAAEMTRDPTLSMTALAKSLNVDRSRLQHVFKDHKVVREAHGRAKAAAVTDRRG